MSNSVEVADLYAALRLKPDKASWAAGDRLIGGIKTGLGLLAGFGAVRWAKGVIEDTVQLGDQLDELSQQTGVNVEDLQALGYAAKFSSIGTEELATNLGKFSKNASAAADGGKKQSKAFRAVGVDAKALVNGTMTMEDALTKVSAKFSSMPDGTKKTVLAMELFGRSGKKMIPFLNAGPKGLAAMTKEARELGIVMDQATIKEMAEFADSQDRLEATWTGIKRQAVIALLPVLQRVMNWILTHRKQVQAFFAAIGRGIKVAAKIIAVVFDKLEDALDTLGGMFGFTSEEVGGLVAALVILGPIATTVGGALAAAFSAAALPVVLIGGLIAGLILLIKNVTFEDIKQKAQDFWDWASSLNKKDVKDLVHDAVAAWDRFTGMAPVPGEEMSDRAKRSLNPPAKPLTPDQEHQMATWSTQQGQAIFEKNSARVEELAVRMDEMQQGHDPLANPAGWTSIKPTSTIKMRSESQLAEDKLNDIKSDVANAIAKRSQSPTNMTFLTTINNAQDLEAVRKLLEESHQQWAEEIANSIDGEAP